MNSGGIAVLVQPSMGYYDSVAKDIPLSILSAVRNVDGFELHVVDQRTLGWKNRLDSLLRKVPVAVCFTALTGRQTKYALELSRHVKETDRKISTVWGGIHPTFCAESTIEDDNIDIVVTGEAEYTFPEVLRAIGERRPPDSQGIWYKRDKEPCRTGGDIEWPDLDQLSFPKYDILDFTTYVEKGHLNFGNVVPVETGRGCTWNCSFCYNSAAHRRKRRSMSARRILDHVHHLRRYVGFEAVNFIDDNFFAETERLDDLLGLLDEEEATFVWGVETGIPELKRTSDERLRDLDRLGLRWLSVGVESGSQSILDKLGKRVKVEEVAVVNARLARHGFSVMFNFMNGYIWERREDLRKTTRLMLHVLSANPKASVQAFQAVVPYPGTRYFKAFQEAGLDTPQTAEEWGECNPDDWLDRQQWLRPRRKILLKTLYVASLFIDRKIYSNVSHVDLWVLVLRGFRFVYRPLAWIRLKFNVSFLPFEAFGLDVAKRLASWRM